MKKLMNSADDFVKEMIEGVYLANKEKLEYVPEINTLYRKDIPEGSRPGNHCDLRRFRP